MSLLRFVAVNTLSVLFLVCLTSLRITETIEYTLEALSLSLPIKNHYPPKCTKEVPAIFSQIDKDEEIIGNGSTIYYNVIEVCCSGYKRYEYDWSKCVADCGNRCKKNSFCIEGGRCDCFGDFVHNQLGDCIPTCPLECPNGRCYLNGTCHCNRGYYLDPTNKFCIPNCTLDCAHNEICAAPETCVCAEGYVKSSEDSEYGCQPVCIPDCGFGHCVGPNQCECFHGYKKKINGSICQANCYMRCDNGFCASQVKCICQDGYKYDLNTTTCLPDCGDTCENGVCIAPGICRCFTGHVRNGATCEPICEEGCGFYGKCIAPNICGCAVVKSRKSAYQSCKNGNCNSLGRCQCNNGTTRFINECMIPVKMNTFASSLTKRRILNDAFITEFDLLIGRFFFF